MKPDRDTTPAVPQARPSLLSLRGLHRNYTEAGRTQPILSALDLDVAEGETIALLGRSGSGKSTLLNLISGIDRPDSGQILIGGEDLTRMNERQRTLFRRRHIGFVYQFFNLIPTLTVKENLLLPLELNDWSAAAARDAAAELLQAVGLSERGESDPESLSGGEQQRVAIARALVHRPMLVLADEPTGNLDATTGRQVLELLARLVSASGKTLLLVTHSREVAALADRVLVLEQGKLTEPKQLPEAFW